MTSTDRYDKRVLRVVCAHRGVETCECRPKALAEVLAQWAAESPPVPPAPPVGSAEGGRPESRGSLLSVLCAWIALGLCAVYLVAVLARYAWRVIVG